MVGQTGIMELVGFKRSHNMTLGQFKSLADEQDIIPAKNLDLAASNASIWAQLKATNSAENTVPQYAVDNSISLYPDSYSGFNMKSFTSILSGERMEGINTPYVNFGMRSTWFGVHTEDSNAGSINQLHYGYPKTWYEYVYFILIKILCGIKLFE